LAGVNGKVKIEVKDTGAVVTGRRTFKLADDWGGDHHDGLPVFVLTRRESGSETGQWPLITYATDVKTAMTGAKQAAGDKNVLVHGTGTAQLALAAGVLDELEIHLMPVLLGQGRSLLLFALRTNRQLPRLSAFFRSARELSSALHFEEWLGNSHTRTGVDDGPALDRGRRLSVRASTRFFA
jgi:dihydrofolate reductase